MDTSKNRVDGRFSGKGASVAGSSWGDLNPINDMRKNLRKGFSERQRESNYAFLTNSDFNAIAPKLSSQHVANSLRISKFAFLKLTNTFAVYYNTNTLYMLSLTNLHFGYTRNLLFRDLNLSLEKGHIYGILGKNGAGKTTLLKNMVGLAFPQSGSAQLNGISLDLRRPDVLSNIFFLPEEIYVPSLSSREFEKNSSVFYPKFDTEEFYKTLDVFEIDPEVKLTELSYGQQKKAMICFALATNTDLLVLDEPTNGLDIPSKVQFRKTLAAALTENRIIVISTHQVRDLDNLIDAVIVLHDNQIAVNTRIDSIAEKLLFLVIDENEECLYHEENINGIRAIIKNPGKLHSKVDLELLFNGIITNARPLTNILNNTYEKPI